MKTLITISILALVLLAAGCATEQAVAPAVARGSITAGGVQLPDEVTVAGVVTQTFGNLNSPFYFTSILFSYDNNYTAASVRVEADLVRGGSTYELLDTTPTNPVSTLSWNVMRMHGNLPIRRGDVVVYRLSDTNVATWTYGAVRSE